MTKEIRALLEKSAALAYATKDFDLFREIRRALDSCIVIRSDLLERIDESAICDGTECSIDADLFLDLVSVLRRPTTNHLT